MTTIIETRQALDALDAGTTMRDVDGWHITKGNDGAYWVIPDTSVPAEDMRTYYYDAGEIAGDYADESSFFPLTVIGHCWFCDRETGRTMYGEDGEDWSCMELHDDPR